MSDEKFLHVSCVVRQAFLWDLLRALEGHKVGNVEVRPVAQTLALPAPKDGRGNSRIRPSGTVRPKVRAAMAINEKHQVPVLARQLGEKKQSVHSAISAMIREGVAKRVAPGIYMRTKPDPEPKS